MKIDRLIILITVCILAGIPSVIAKDRLAILPFKGIGIEPVVAEAVTETFITTIASTGNFDIIERAQLQQVMDELNLAMSDEFEDETAIEIGRLASSSIIMLGSVVKLGNRYVFNFRGIDIESGTVLFGNNAACDTEEDLLDIVLDSAVLIGNNNIKEAMIVIDRDKGQKVRMPAWSFTDTFDNVNNEYWKKQNIHEDFSSVATDGVLQWKADYRKGRLSSYSTFESQAFKADSFAVEVQFRDRLASAKSIALFVGNSGVFKGNSLRVKVDMQKEYYGFSWSSNASWQSNPDNVIPELFGDETETFHTLKIVYDYPTKTAYGFIDNVLIDSVTDFSFIRIEKLYVQLYVFESASSLGKGVHVEWDNFRTTIPPK
jgi:TolB-like protein